MSKLLSAFAVLWLSVFVIFSAALCALRLFGIV